jgi:hypothetical protein
MQALDGQITFTVKHKTFILFNTATCFGLNCRLSTAFVYINLTEREADGTNTARLKRKRYTLKKVIKNNNAQKDLQHVKTKLHHKR